jgi:CRP-like cAMP-binding protein/ribonuclease BN (tRNA processing enzyme)
MKIKVLGCMGGRIPGQGLTGLLVDDELLLDAGSVTFSLDIDQQNKIKYLFLSHTHLDHLYGLGFLLENRFFAKLPEPLKIFAAKEAVEILTNDFLIEDIVGSAVFQNLPELAKLIPVDPGKEYQAGQYLVEPVPVNHYSGPLGYFVSDGKARFLFTSDTGPTEKVWERFKQEPECRLLITEVSFPNKFDEVARLSRHLTPSLLQHELEKAAAQQCTLYLYHFKPGYLDQLFEELTEITDFDLHLLKSGMELKVEQAGTGQADEKVDSVAGKVPKFDYSKDMYEQRQNLDRDFGISYEQGVIIFEENDPGKQLFIIQEGQVEVYRVVAGKKKVLTVLGPGDVFGEMSLICNQPRSASVRALTKVRVYTFDRPAFEQMIRQNYGVAVKIIRMLAQRLQEADVHIENLMYPDSESKLINTVIRAVEDEGIETKAGFLLRISPEQLATRTDLPMNELKRILAKLIEAKLIAFREGQFEVPDLKQLKKFLAYLELKQKYEQPGKFGL